MQTQVFPRERLHIALLAIAQALFNITAITVRLHCKGGRAVTAFDKKFDVDNPEIIDVLNLRNTDASANELVMGSTLSVAC